MFFFKKILMQIKWFFQIEIISQRVLKLYYLSMLVKDISFEDKSSGVSVSIVRDNVTIKFNKVTCVFDISRKNSIYMSVRFYDDKGKSRTFLSKYFIFVDGENINDNETLFYAQKIINDIDKTLNDIMFNLLSEDVSLYSQYMKVKPSKLRDKELIQDFVPNELKSSYVKNKLDIKLEKKNQPTKRVSKV